MPSSAFRLLLAGLLVSGSALAADAPAQPATWGWVETLTLMPEQAPLKAKLDTGAQTSVLDARNIVRIRKNGERWVQYDVMIADPATGKEQRLPFERRVERVLKFKTDTGVERSPVVLMDVCLGGKVYREQFTLRDRQTLDYPVLLGRRTLEHLGAVDASKTQTAAPTCKP